jgi:hypothetical protein
MIQSLYFLEARQLTQLGSLGFRNGFLGRFLSECLEHGIRSRVDDPQRDRDRPA